MVKNYIQRLEDGSIVGLDGKIYFMSADRFRRDVCEGDSCFICGKGRQEVRFNDEHILPNWLLRHLDLHHETISLPNGQTHRYGTYTIPCCENCNSLLGLKLEVPLSKVLLSGHDGVAQHIRTEGPFRIFCWMACIFLKIHLKDATLREHLNFNDGDEKIGRNYPWEIFHHIHSMVRSSYTEASIAMEAFGSFALMPAADRHTGKRFDLVDLSAAQTLAVRIDDYVLYAVFDDACAVLHGLSDMIERITAPLNSMQTREIAALFAACNMHLINRPVFWTEVEDAVSPKTHIRGLYDGSPKFEKKNHKLIGQFLETTIGSAVRQVSFAGISTEDALRLMHAGILSVVFDDKGNFIKDGFRRTEESGSATRD